MSKRVIHQATLLLAIVCFPIFTFAQGRQTDIYDRIASLVDTLRTWSEQPPVMNPEKTAVFSIHDRCFYITSVNNSDTLTIPSLFPECTIEPMESDSLLLISLPRYMNLLTTSLILTSSESSKSSGSFYWTVPFQVNNDQLLVDNVPVSIDSKVVRDSFLIKEIHARLTKLRTLSLSPELRPGKSNLLGESAASLPVQVTIRGRNRSDLTFTQSSWFSALERIAAGLQVYAGILDVKVDTTDIECNYYIVITYPQTEGHHFLKWRELLNISENVWQPKSIIITFIPYIRTDNLHDLFAAPDSTYRKVRQERLIPP